MAEDQQDIPLISYTPDPDYKCPVCEEPLDSENYPYRVYSITPPEYLHLECSDVLIESVIEMANVAYLDMQHPLHRLYLVGHMVIKHARRKLEHEGES